MTADEVREILSRHTPALRSLGVLRLDLFGSVARGEATAASDVDLLVELDPTRSIDLLDFAHIKGELEDMLGCPVDLVERHMVRQPWRSTVFAEVVRAA